MRVMLHANKITLGSLEPAKATIKGLGGTIVYHRQDSRAGGGVIADLTARWRYLAAVSAPSPYPL